MPTCLLLFLIHKVSCLYQFSLSNSKGSPSIFLQSYQKVPCFIEGVCGHQEDTNAIAYIGMTLNTFTWVAQTQNIDAQKQVPFIYK